MTTLFNRKCSVTVGKPIPENYVQIRDTSAVLVEGLRVKFKVVKTLSEKPNTADVSISNLAQSTRASFQSKGSRMRLMAGYQDTLAQVFYGDTRYIEHARDGADWTTKISCGDGEVPFQFARSSKSWKKGVSFKEIAAQLIKDLAVDPGDALKKILESPETFAKGYVVHGKSSVEFDRLVKSAGWEWSIQNGRLQLLRPGQTNKDLAFVLSPESGLVGSPEHGTGEKKDGPPVLKAKALLLPTVIPGCRVVLQTETYKGIYRVQRVEHTGDTAGGEWYSEMELSAVT